MLPDDRTANKPPDAPTALPFGKHRNQPLTTVPHGYLLWVARECRIGHELRSAVVAELTRRGIKPPEERPLPDEPWCERCGGMVDIKYSWMEDCRGQKRIRRECARCGKWLGQAPNREPFIGLANAASSPTALLDVLVEVDARGVRLRNDGKAVDFASFDDWKQASPELRQRLKEVRHRLATMLPRTMPQGHERN